MKKLSLLIAVLLTLLICVGGIIIALSMGIMQPGSIREEIHDDNDGDLVDFINRYIQTPVGQGEFAIVLNLTGQASFSPPDVRTMRLENPAANLEYFVEVGDTVERGHVLYRNNNRDFTAPVSGRVVAITHAHRLFTIEIFSTENPSVVISVPEEHQAVFITGLDISMSYQDNEPVPATIKRIDPNVENGYFTVELHSDFAIFPGSTVDVEILFEVLTDVVLVPAMFVRYNLAGVPHLRMLVGDTQTNDVQITVLGRNDDIYALVGMHELVGQMALISHEELLMREASND